MIAGDHVHRTRERFEELTGLEELALARPLREVSRKKDEARIVSVDEAMKLIEDVMIDPAKVEV